MRLFFSTRRVVGLLSTRITAQLKNPICSKVFRSGGRKKKKKMLIPALHRLGCSYTKRGRVVYHNTLKLHFSRLHLPASGPQHTPYVSAPRRGGGAEGEKRQRRRDEEGKKKKRAETERKEKD